MPPSSSLLAPPQLLQYALAAAAIAILVTMGMGLARAYLGPTVFERILATNLFGSTTVLLIAVYGFIQGRPLFLDIALVYALINFLGTIAVVKFVIYSRMGTAKRENRDLGDL